MKISVTALEIEIEVEIVSEIEFEIEFEIAYSSGTSVVLIDVARVAGVMIT